MFRTVVINLVLQRRNNLKTNQISKLFGRKLTYTAHFIQSYYFYFLANNLGVPKMWRRDES